MMRRSKASPNRSGAQASKVTPDPAPDLAPVSPAHKDRIESADFFLV
jgi:hypothetical protein